MSRPTFGGRLSLLIDVVVMKIIPSAAVLLCPMLASAQLAVTVSPVKVTGQKAIVSLAMKNSFGEEIKSARASVFLLDEHGKMIGNGTKWVVGGGQGSPGLAVGATNAFHFVIGTEKPFTTTNLTARVTFSQVILANGKLADPKRDVSVRTNPEQ